MVQDRLEYGDFVFNQKSGEVIRKPVSLRDATKTASDLMTRQAALHKEASESTTNTATASVADQLKQLADEFAKFNKRNTGPVEEAVIRNKREEMGNLRDGWANQRIREMRFGGNFEWNKGEVFKNGRIS